MTYFALVVVAAIQFCIILAYDEPICEDLLGTELCSKLKSEGSCDQSKYKHECAKTCLQCWSDDYWYVYRYPNDSNSDSKYCLCEMSSLKQTPNQCSRVLHFDLKKHD